MRWTAGLGLALALAVIGRAAMANEEPAYAVEVADGAFEVRAYEPMIVAEADARGDRAEAVNAGFRRLAAYIFAQERPGPKIDMTVPVSQSARADESWTIAFVMPSRYTMDTLPVPVAADVRLRAQPAERVATVRFSGRPHARALARHERELRGWMTARGLVAAGPARYAYYDAPWKPPFLRRNEVIIPLEPRQAR